ncbi:MAG: YidC/Oxa1 family membrane protein insertase [Clostridiales bacterium]|nr:YidC/Oxa1 family membrane protein insertase [Clostridiales bacterium]
MQILSALYSLIFGPLETVFEIIFSILNKNIRSAGVSVIFLSLAFSLLVLPLYRRADRIQEETRIKEEKLKPVIDHIKKVFKGDERFMMLQTYYRQNDYSPLSVVKSTVSLLLQIPFFLAAYRMLSNNMYLTGAAFGPIADLGKPDALLVIGAVTINLLPIIMTLVNVISSAIYTTKLPLKSKLQLYGMAAVFLILLYNSPSGMVLYWTCNNLFALVKNIVLKFFPIKEKAEAKEKVYTSRHKVLFIMSCIAAGFYTGWFLPSSVMSLAPQEFVNICTMGDPNMYLVDSLCLGLGLFVLWPAVFSGIASDKGKRAMAYVMFILTCLLVVNSQLFSNGFGTMNNELVYDAAPVFLTKDILINLAVCVAAGAAAYLLVRFARSVAAVVAVSASIVFFVMGIVNIFKIEEGYKTVKDQYSAEMPEFTLSTEGQNVVIIMLDRAVGPMIPYILAEHPDLEERLDGFTYYSNTVSFGAWTNFAAPALYGGYEYTPDKLNARDDELLMDKHDEALKVLPAIFSENGFDSVMINPSYAGYTWYPSLGIFDDLEGVKAYNTLYKYSKIDFGKAYDDEIKHNLFSYSLYKSAPVLLQSVFYDNGNYNETTLVDVSESSQIITGPSTAYGHNKDFEAEYYALLGLESMTVIEDGSGNNFLFFSCKSTHNPALLSEPDYLPADYVDNTAFDAANMARFTVNGKTMLVLDSNDYAHYQINTASLYALADWLDYLRDQGVYDNTKIIVVADHGSGLGGFSDLFLSDFEVGLDAEWFTPLFMVKDFGATGFTTSDEFMTNADTPYLALKDVIDDPVNPYTGNPITNEDKYGDLLLFNSTEWEVENNNGTTYLPGYWYSVHDDLWNKDNWTYEGEW